MIKQLKPNTETVKGSVKGDCTTTNAIIADLGDLREKDDALEKSIEKVKSDLFNLEIRKISDMSTEIFDMKNATKSYLDKLNNSIEKIDNDLRYTKQLHGSGLKSLQEEINKEKEYDDRIAKEIDQIRADGRTLTDNLVQFIDSVDKRLAQRICEEDELWANIKATKKVAFLSWIIGCLGFVVGIVSILTQIH